MIGKSIAHYKILEKLGEGGMGVVYKARDTKLDRFVALKFLPPHLNRAEEEKKRFIHEAKAASALNHPNIATIYEIDEADGQMFIAMEYIEGQSLQDVGTRGPVPLRDALNYATQIAEGLAKAHAKGIIHRDIKPANILVSEDGVVKLVDFGLAKLAGRTMLTKEGTTMGTIAYMSPEQAKGAAVDHRTDIWALGVVLYEMLTGEPPFKGDYEQAVIYSILNEEPDLSGLPEALMPVVQKALSKQAEERYQNVGEMLTDLKAVTGSQPLSGLDAKGTGGTKKASSRKIPLLIGSLALVVLTVAAIGYLLSTHGYSNLKIISTRPITTTPGFEGQPTWSPDGTRIAYTSDESGRQDIWVRQLRAGQSINLTKGQPGSKNTAPAWSPDGEWIAFASDREQRGLFVIPSLGGNARQVLASGKTEIDAVSWSPDASKLVFVTSKVYFSANAIYTVSVKSGEKTQVPFQLKGISLQDPAWSPDGERLAIVEAMGTGITTSRIWTIKLDGSDPHLVTDATSFNNKPVWSADGKRILFISDRGGSYDIWWVPIDANGGVIGPAKALTTGVGVGAIALSRDGKKLAYEKILQTSSIWSMPMTKKKGLLTLEDAKLISAGNDLIEKAEISPDGRWLAFDSNRAGNTDIWIMKPDGSDLRQVTTDLAHDWAPTWSPDSKRIAFHSLRSGNRDIWVKPIAGGAAKQLTTDPSKDWEARWSPKSADIAFTSYRGGGADIWVVRENSAPRQLTFQRSKGIEVGAWSPQGNMIAFVSLQTGKEELYLIWTKTGKTEQLTANNFRNITPFAWARDGKTIYFFAVKGSETTGNIYAISTTDGAIRKLTDFPNDPSKFLNFVTSDGERFYLVFNEHKSDIWVAELAEEK